MALTPRTLLDPSGGAPTAARRPGAPGSVAMTSASRPVTGASAWAWGLLPCCCRSLCWGRCRAGGGMVASHRSLAREGGVAKANAESARRWGKAFLTVTTVLVVAQLVWGLIRFTQPSSAASGFFPQGIPITLYVLVCVVHLVVVISSPALGAVRSCGAVHAERAVSIEVPLPNGAVAGDGAAGAAGGGVAWGRGDRTRCWRRDGASVPHRLRRGASGAGLHDAALQLPVCRGGAGMPGSLPRTRFSRGVR